MSVTQGGRGLAHCSLLTAQHSFSQELGKTLEDKPGSLCNYVKNLEKYKRARKIKNIPVPAGLADADLEGEKIQLI